MAGGVVVGGAGHLDILGNHRIAFLLELLGENFGQGLEADAHHTQSRADCQRVLLYLVAAVVRQFRHGQGTELDPVRRRAGLDGLSVVHYRRAGTE